jgi:hypothetical protein
MLIKPVSTTQQTALNLKQTWSPSFTGTVKVVSTKAMVGLGNVDNI